ncbi:MAG TPA: hypothetical protein HPP77_02525 [Candidatus Hydrogenedentes bacterium]|nr:hypothetical protein [Candidatus Hydrogenedentota bacterium]HIJ73602.1 hypothetical protein [Candidatus Hydrogenedentota bacterium]
MKQRIERTLPVVCLALGVENVALEVAEVGYEAEPFPDAAGDAFDVG